MTLNKNRTKTKKKIMLKTYKTEKNMMKREAYIKLLREIVG